MVMIDPMLHLRQVAVGKVNSYFNGQASLLQHKEQAYPVKRAAAETLLSGGSASEELQAEAALTGVNVIALANLIMSKPLSSIAQRELDRQRLMHQVQTIQSPKELDQMLIDLGVGGLSNG